MLLLMTGAFDHATSSSMNDEREPPNDQLTEAVYDSNTRNYGAKTYYVDYQEWQEFTHSSRDFPNVDQGYTKKYFNRKKRVTHYNTTLLRRKHDSDEILELQSQYLPSKTKKQRITTHTQKKKSTKKPRMRASKKHSKQNNNRKRKHIDSSIESAHRVDHENKNKSVKRKRNSYIYKIVTALPDEISNTSADMLWHISEQNGLDLPKATSREHRRKGRFGILRRLRDTIERKDLIDTILGWFRPRTPKPAAVRFTWWTTTRYITSTTPPPMGWARAVHGVVPLQAFEGGRQLTGKLMYIARAVTKGVDGCRPGTMIYGDRLAMIPVLGWARPHCHYDILLGRPGDFRWISWRSDIVRHVDLVVAGWQILGGRRSALYICQGKNLEQEFSIGFMDENAYCEVPNFEWKTAGASRNSFILSRIYVPRMPKRGKTLEV